MIGCHYLSGAGPGGQHALIERSCAERFPLDLCPGQLYLYFCWQLACG